MPSISEPKRQRLMEQLHSTNWFDLPFEMREMVMDSMDGKTRCRFAQCSKQCEEEAKTSKNYAYKIELKAGDRQNSFGYYTDSSKLELHLTHRKTLESDYLLQFVDVGDEETLVSYCKAADSENMVHRNTMRRRAPICGRFIQRYEVIHETLPLVKWRKFESGKPKDVRLKYLKEYLEKYNNSIKVFVSHGPTPSVRDFTLKNLKRLEEIDIPKVKDKDENVAEIGFVGENQLTKIKHVNMPRINLRFDQVTNFKGQTMICAWGSVDAKKINKLLRLLKNGEIHENIKYFELKCNMIRCFIKNVVKDLGITVPRQTDKSYTFYIESETRKNGKYRVFFEPRSALEIKWVSI